MTNRNMTFGLSLFSTISIFLGMASLTEAKTSCISQFCVTLKDAPVRVECADYSWRLNCPDGTFCVTPDRVIHLPNSVCDMLGIGGGELTSDEYLRLMGAARDVKTALLACTVFHEMSHAAQDPECSHAEGEASGYYTGLLCMQATYNSQCEGTAIQGSPDCQLLAKSVAINEAAMNYNLCLQCADTDAKKNLCKTQCHVSLQNRGVSFFERQKTCGTLQKLYRENAIESTNMKAVESLQ